MEEENFKIILKKYENGEATKKEIEIVDTFFNSMQNDGHTLNTFKHDLALKNRIYQSIEKRKTSKSIWRWTVAASIMLLLGLGIYSYDLTSVYSHGDTAQLIERTQFGEQAEVVLPDGTLVILNGDSSLEYPKTFNDTLRQVKLQGQAFFDVTKNPKQPFVIKSGNISTKVLGTTFNVIGKDSIVEVIVSTGLVNVLSNSDSVFLKPNQKVTYDRNSDKLSKDDVNAEITNLWWKGEVVLEKIKIQDLVIELQKLYNIPFIYKDENMKRLYLYSLRLKKDEALNELIERINFINEVKLIKHDDRVEISKK